MHGLIFVRSDLSLVIIEPCDLFIRHVDVEIVMHKIKRIPFIKFVNFCVKVVTFGLCCLWKCGEKMEEMSFMKMMVLIFLGSVNVQVDRLLMTRVLIRVKDKLMK